MNSENTSPSVPEYIFGESLQRFLRAHLDEHTRAGIVQRSQPFDELHRRSDLLAPDVQHLGHDIRPRRIELAVDVRDDRDPRRLQAAGAPASARSGSLAGATIEVWNAWLTGSGTTL